MRGKMSLCGMKETESNGNKQKMCIGDAAHSLSTLLH